MDTMLTIPKKDLKNMFFQLLIWRNLVLLTENAKITEKFTRISKDEIIYQFFVEDKDVYSDIWAGEMVLTSDSDRIYEYACHEGNYSMENILAGARAQD